MKAGSVRPGMSVPVGALAHMPALALAAWMSAGCATAGGAPVAESGETVFNNYCAPCHGVDGTGIDVAKAPSIAGLPEWYIRNQVDGFRTGLRGTHYDDVQGMRMRPMALTLAPDEIDGVIKHAASLPAKAPAATLVGGDATKGAGLYATCQACHGADGKGNEALGAPPLTYTHDWYLANQLHNFKQGIRGANPKDTRGATMRPMAATLADEQAIKDVLAYVATLPK